MKPPGRLGPGAGIGCRAPDSPRLATRRKTVGEHQEIFTLAGPIRYPWLQVLRASAALSVAVLHVSDDTVASGNDPAGLIAHLAVAMPWDAGVDLFFVISGFVIVSASAGLFGRPDGWGVFLHRRLARIVPLYWAMTTVFLALFLLDRQALHTDIGGPLYIAASYAFIPMARPDQVIHPALGLGWTLNYEMFFYAVLAALLWLPRGRAVAAATALLAGLVAAGWIIPPTNDLFRFWSDPVVLEFVFGMGLATLAARGLILPGWARLALVAAAILALYFAAGAGDSRWRMLAFGLPGVMLVAAAVFAPRPAAHGVVMRALVGLGDASYALYLCHPFAMRAVTLLGRHIPAHSEAIGLALLVLSLVVAELCAVAIHWGFERPMLRLLRPGRPAEPAPLGATT
jgi:exopolysaccharide production protein ExoZ